VGVTGQQLELQQQHTCMRCSNTEEQQHDVVAALQALVGSLIVVLSNCHSDGCSTPRS
jgi:hypothetical protein